MKPKFWGNPEKFYTWLPASLAYVMQYGGIWFNRKALEALKQNL